MYLRTLAAAALWASVVVVPTARGEGATPPVASHAPLTPPQALTLAEALNKGEADAARIAVARTETPSVKALAEHLMQAHVSAGRAEEELARSLNFRPRGSAQLNQVKAKQRALAQRLGVAPKADFDRTYLDAEVHGHQQALELIDQDLLPSAASPQLENDLQRLRDRMADQLDDVRGVLLELEEKGEE